MKGLVCFGLVFLSLGMSACHAPSSTFGGKTHEYTLKQKCPTLKDMRVGDVLVFNVAENPSTGYQWQLLKPLKIFKIEETYLPSRADEKVVGATGIKTFRFTAEQPGQDYIELAHIRSWESSEQPDQKWQCRIRVS